MNLLFFCDSGSLVDDQNGSAASELLDLHRYRAFFLELDRVAQEVDQNLFNPV